MHAIEWLDLTGVHRFMLPCARHDMCGTCGAFLQTEARAFEMVSTITHASICLDVGYRVVCRHRSALGSRTISVHLADVEDGYQMVETKVDFVELEDQEAILGWLLLDHNGLVRCRLSPEFFALSA
jgi:hypothetical protein